MVTGKTDKDITIKPERKVPPYKSITEAQMMVIENAINPSAERMAEFSNVNPSMTFALAMSMVRERAADPGRDRLKEPLSMVWRQALFQLWRGEKFKTSLLAGNVALGLRTDNEMDLISPRNTTRF